MLERAFNPHKAVAPCPTCARSSAIGSSTTTSTAASSNTSHPRPAPNGKSAVPPDSTRSDRNTSYDRADCSRTSILA